MMVNQFTTASLTTKLLAEPSFLDELFWEYLTLVDVVMRLPGLRFHECTIKERGYDINRLINVNYKPFTITYSPLLGLLTLK